MPVLVTVLNLCQHTHRKINFTNNGKTIRNKNYNFTIKFLFMSVNPIENKIENSLVILFPFFSETHFGVLQHTFSTNTHYLFSSINQSVTYKKIHFSRFPFIFILKKSAHPPRLFYFPHITQQCTTKCS